MKILYQEIKTKKGIIRGLLTTPDTDFKNIVVMFHGYTGHKNENGFLFKQITNKCVENGYATIRFDFIGSGDSDGEFKDMTFLGEVEDARIILNYALELNKHKPLILLGFSMGGAIAGYLCYEYYKDIKKLILLSPAGSMNLLAKATFTNNYVNEDGNVDLGGYYLNKAFLDGFDNVDLYQNVDKFDKPTLIIHGEKDLSVPCEYGKKYHSLMKNSEFHMIMDSTHCYTKVHQRAEVKQYIEDFLNKN